MSNENGQNILYRIFEIISLIKKTDIDENFEIIYTTATGAEFGAVFDKDSTRSASRFEVV